MSYCWTPPPRMWICKCMWHFVHRRTIVHQTRGKVWQLVNLAKMQAWIDIFGNSYWFQRDWSMFLELLGLQNHKFLDRLTELFHHKMESYVHISTIWIKVSITLRFSVLSLPSLQCWVPMHMWGPVSLVMWQVSSVWVMWQHNRRHVWMHQCPSTWWRILPALPSTQYVLMSDQSSHKYVHTARNLKLWHCTRLQVPLSPKCNVLTHTVIDQKQ